MTSDFVDELFAVPLHAGIPLIIVFNYWEKEAFIQWIQSAFPDIIVLAYAAGLSVLPVFIKLVLHFIYCRNEQLKKFLAWISRVLDIGGEAIIGMLRTMAGVLICFPLLWLAIEPETFSLETTLLLLIVGVCGLVDIAAIKVGLRFFDQKTNPKVYY